MMLLIMDYNFHIPLSSFIIINIFEDFSLTMVYF